MLVVLVLKNIPIFEIFLLKYSNKKNLGEKKLTAKF